MMVGWETHKTPCRTKVKLKARITTAFINLNKETIWKSCRKFRNRLTAVIEANGDFLFIILIYDFKIFSSKVKLATIVEGNPKAPFSIATTPRCRGGRYSFPGLLYFTLDPYLIMLSVKQGGIKYHYLSLWYDSTWDCKSSNFGKYIR